MNAEITIHAIGFDDLTVVLPKPPDKVSELEVLQAKVIWGTMNDAGDLAGLTFVDIKGTAAPATLNPFRIEDI